MADKPKRPRRRAKNRNIKSEKQRMDLNGRYFHVGAVGLRNVVAGAGLVGLAGLLAACATPAPAPQPTEAPASVEAQRRALAAERPARKVLKRKVAVGRFTNQTLYGRALFTGEQMDAMGRQVGDILSTRLVQTDRFIVLERPDLDVVEDERALAGIDGKLPGANALVVGSLAEFGRTTEGQSGFLSKTKRQVARAKVYVRLIDPTTGVVFFSATGTGQAATESGTTVGFGSRAEYDQTLNDRAIAAAIGDVMNELVNKLEEKPWWSDILEIQGNQVVISGGARQGLKPGQELAVMQRGRTVTSSQTGFPIELPPTRVGTVRITQTFGSNDTDEAATARIVDGRVPSGSAHGVFVADPTVGS